MKKSKNFNTIFFEFLRLIFLTHFFMKFFGFFLFALKINGKNISVKIFSVKNISVKNGPTDLLKLFITNSKNFYEKVESAKF